MKKLSILLLAALLILSTVVWGIACSSDSSDGIAGTYINQDDASAYIDLREDGTFYAEEEGMEFTGEWEVEGNEIRLYWDDSVSDVTIEGNRITELDGTVWIKQAPATYTASDIGADGGVLEVTAADGTTCSLSIQPGTLTESTNIKITTESSSRGNSLGALTNDFLLEPEGIEFDVPMTIAIIVPNPLPVDRLPAILHTAADGSEVLLDTQVDGQKLSASITHFSSLSPVAPTAAELELYWDSIVLEIDTDGLSVDRVRTLASMYLHAQADSEVYRSIDLSAWENELWAQTNDLIIMGSLRCSSGDHAEAEYIFEAARNIAILCYFADLELEAEQALDNCRNHQIGSSFPEIYYRISEVTGGVANISLNDWSLASAVWGDDPEGGYNGQYPGETRWEGPLRATDPEGTPWGQALTFKFKVYPYSKLVGIPSGYFEVKVDGQIAFSEQLTAANIHETSEVSNTLTS